MQGKRRTRCAADIQFISSFAQPLINWTLGNHVELLITINNDYYLRFFAKTKFTKLTFGIIFLEEQIRQRKEHERYEKERERSMAKELVSTRHSLV